jgi:hypothetical protein
MRARRRRSVQMTVQANWRPGERTAPWDGLWQHILMKVLREQLQAVELDRGNSHSEREMPPESA